MFTVVFEVRPAAGRQDAYFALAAELRPVLETTAGFRPTASPAVASMRHRAVRVIRDYGMFDRREAPQYFLPVVSRAI